MIVKEELRIVECDLRTDTGFVLLYGMWPVGLMGGIVDHYSGYGLSVFDTVVAEAAGATMVLCRDGDRRAILEKVARKGGTS